MNTTLETLPGEERYPAPFARSAALLAAFAVASYALAVYAGALPSQVGAPIYIRPAEGLALGALLAARRALWVPFIGIAFLTTLVVSLQAGLDLEAASLVALAGAVGPAVIAAGLLRLAGGRVNLGSLAGLTGFLVNLVPMTAVLSLADASIGTWLLGGEFRSRWTAAFVSDFLNMVVVAPLVITWGRGEWNAAAAEAFVESVRARAAEGAVLFAGLAAATHLVFRSPADAPFVASLAYLCSPFLIWAALRFGLRAATIANAGFALIAYWHTAGGLGPFAMLGDAAVTSLLQLQGFIAAAVVTALFAAGLLAEREFAAQATEAWRRRYEAAVRASGNLLYELDPVTGKILWDGDTRAVLGVPARKLSHLRQWAARVHSDDRARLRTVGERLLAGEVTHVAMEHRMRRGPGEWITVGVNGYAIEEPTRRVGRRRRIIGLVSDVTERIRAEAERQALAAQLRQAEKMEAVGRLAGGIAHDFNNILGAILGYGELAQAKAKAQSDPQLERYVDTIVKAGNRGKALVSQILSYSRAESGIQEPVVLGQVVAEVAELLRGSSSARLDLRVSLPPEEVVVSGDHTRLHQLVMNLASNAIHAMPGGGVLEIGLSRRTLEAPVRTRLSEVPAGEWAVLEVRDTGEGIPEEVIDRIFEPFFTTKAAGHGTGLGLALVHSIVREQGGAIDVESEVGRGTVFTVWLPPLDGAGAAAPGEEAPVGGRGQVVLVVDDEPEVLAALEEMLATLGYEPAGYADSRAALEAFRANPARFEAVISDEVMPGLTGTQLAVELRKVNPAIPIVIATGFGGAGFETRAHSAGVNRVLRKPFRMQDIGEALRGVFGAP